MLLVTMDPPRQRDGSTAGELFVFILCVIAIIGLFWLIGGCAEQKEAARSNAWALERARDAVESYAPDLRERVNALWKAAATMSPNSFASQEASPLAQEARKAAEFSGIAPMAQKRKE